MNTEKIKKLNLQGGRCWEIILDNAGGATLLVYGRYQHHYLDMTKLATDLEAFVDNGIESVAEWDGNELCFCEDPSTVGSDGICVECGGCYELDPPYADISNGGYEVLTAVRDVESSGRSHGDLIKAVFGRKMKHICEQKGI